MLFFYIFQAAPEETRPPSPGIADSSANEHRGREKLFNKWKPGDKAEEQTQGLNN